MVTLEMAWRGPFEPMAGNVATVRAFARQRFAGVAPSSLDDVVLVVSELVSNVVGHAHTRFCVGLGLGPGRARIEVADHAPWTPSQGFPAPHLHGRGLVLVRALCEDWGVEFSDGAKKVWAEMAVSTAPVSGRRRR